MTRRIITETLWALLAIASWTVVGITAVDAAFA